jgi:hypothetical protein
MTVTYPSGTGVNRMGKFGPDVSQISGTVRGGDKYEFITNFLVLVAMHVYQSAQM